MQFISWRHNRVRQSVCSYERVFFETGIVMLWFFSMAQRPLMGQGLFLIEALRSHTPRYTTLGRTPLEELSTRRRYLYLTTHNIHNWKISMPLEGFKPTTPASEQSLTHALDSAATGIGNFRVNSGEFIGTINRCRYNRVRLYIVIYVPVTKFVLCFAANI